MRQAEPAYGAARFSRAAATPLSPVESLQLEVWEQGEKRDSSDTLVHELVLEQARRSPAAVAVRAGTRRLTYGELARASAACSQHLQSLGVGPGAAVGVLLDRSPDLIVALLGILRCGAFYVSLGLDDPSSRLEATLGSLQVQVLVTDRQRVQSTLPMPLRISQPSDWVDLSPPPATPCSPADICYASFTSGSTGVPKGVLVPHRAVVRLVDRPSWTDLHAGDTVLQLAPMAFDASTFEIWGALSVGATLAVAPPGPVDLEALAQLIHAERVTVLWLTAGLFEQIVRMHADCLSNVRQVVAGGDVVSAAALRALSRRAPRVTFTNGYGPTENTTFTSTWTSPGSWSGTDVPIGCPIDGTHVLVLDERLQRVAPGIAGELYTGGLGLAHGYAGQAAETAARFVADPYRDGDRLYRTGDLCRWTDRGVLEFLGRADDQVKVLGYRVEPRSVEALLARDKRVEQAVVVAQVALATGTRLLAYVTARCVGAERDRLPAELREQLQRELPVHSVPWAVLVVAAMPLTPNGKVDRGSLPAIARAPRELPYEFVSPKTRTEQLIAALWGEILAVEPVGVNDDFFDLGGHSLGAAAFVELLEQRYQVDLPARVLYLEPTVAEVAFNMDRIAASR